MFEIGDFIKAKDDAIEGKVLAVNTQAKTLTICHDDFEIDLHFHEVIKVGDANTIISLPKKFDLHQNQKSKKSVEIENKNAKIGLKVLNSLEAEVDLHTQAILEHESRITMDDIRAFQLLYLKRAVEICRSRKIKKLNIIHGKGEGVLRESVHEYIRGLEGASIAEAPVKRYGSGATALYFNTFN